MSHHSTRGNRNKATTFPSKEKRKTSCRKAQRVNRSYAGIDHYQKAIHLLTALRLRPILLARINANLDCSFSIIAYCKNITNTLELWEVSFSGHLVEAQPYKIKDTYVDTLVQHTYLNLALCLSKEPEAPPIVAPGILFKPLIEL